MPDTQTAAAAPEGDHRRHSISAKIIFLVFLCTFSTALVISWITIHATHGQLREQIDTGFPSLLERSGTQLDPWLDAGTRSLEQLRDRSKDGPRLRALAKPQGRGGSVKRVAKILADFEAGSAHFDRVGLVSLDGSWLVPIPGLEETRPAGLDPAAPSRIAESGAHGVAALAVMPLVAGKAEAGFLLARYDRPGLEHLLEAERQGNPGTLLLADERGRVLAAIGDDASERADAEHSIAQLTAGETASIQEYASEFGVHVLGAISPLPGTPHWVLVIEAPFATAFEPVLRVVAKIFVADLLIILLFIAFAYRITTQMLRPIEDLSEGARQASRGDLGQAISDPGTHDEIWLLTRAFNDMMAKLHQSQEELRQANRQLTSQNEELQQANEVLSQLSITDGLTKLHNHRYFQESLTREIKRQGRNQKPLSMLLVDLDDFKTLNDRLGHASGDELLTRVASIMAATVRESDLLARYGGEEFVVLANDTDLDGAVALAEKIRMAVEQTPHIVDDSLRPVRITVSAGVAQFTGNRRLFFESSDRALYRAKDLGKNCVVAADDDLA